MTLPEKYKMFHAHIYDRYNPQAEHTVKVLAHTRGHAWYILHQHPDAFGILSSEMILWVSPGYETPIQ